MQVVYHADFEKNIRGTITSVTDDSEMKRVKEVANVISQAAYTRRRSSSENTGMYVCGILILVVFILHCNVFVLYSSVSRKT